MNKPLNLLDLKCISYPAYLKMHLLDSVNSTNEFLKAFIETKIMHACLAEQQTAGKGRLGRHWHSPFGENLYFSCLYYFEKSMNDLAGLSLVIALATVKVLNSYLPSIPFCVKWPNDVMHGSHKVSGVLIELGATKDHITPAIIGVGVNVKMLGEQPSINQAWTSLQKVVGKEVDRNEFSSKLINGLINYLDKFAASGFSSFVAEWMQVDGLLNQPVTLMHVNRQIEGEVLGVNTKGQLLLHTQQGEVCAYSFGEVAHSLRPPTSEARTQYTQALKSVNKHD